MDSKNTYMSIFKELPTMVFQRIDDCISLKDDKLKKAYKNITSKKSINLYPVFN